MYELISNLILYGNLPEDEILVQLAKLLSDDEKSNHELRQEGHEKFACHLKEFQKRSDNDLGLILA